MQELKTYLDKIVEVNVAQYGGGYATAIGRVTDLTAEDMILSEHNCYGRHCIDYRDILDIKIVEIAPDDIYNLLCNPTEEGK